MMSALTESDLVDWLIAGSVVGGGKKLQAKAAEGPTLKEFNTLNK